jgi:hypothetical protein
VTLRAVPVRQFHEGKVWELAINLDKQYVHFGRQWWVVFSRLVRRAIDVRIASLTRVVTSE